MAKMKKTVTMADIAERMQVSIVTVSKALSGQKGVSEEVRARSVELAKEMGYRSKAMDRAGEIVPTIHSFPHLCGALERKR